MMQRNLLSILVLFSLFGWIGCDSGDWLGPVERGARAAFNGWDMWANPGVRPYENPMPLPPEGSVPIGGRPSYSSTLVKLADAGDSPQDDALAYRRYCYHCHGPNGANRVIVGESFNPPLPDLRQVSIQSMSDEVMYDHLTRGTQRLIPFGDSIDPVELLRAIHHIRTLADKEAHPHFEAKHVAPIE